MSTALSPILDALCADLSVKEARELHSLRLHLNLGKADREIDFSFTDAMVRSYCTTS